MPERYRDRRRTAAAGPTRLGSSGGLGPWGAAAAAVGGGGGGWGDAAAAAGGGLGDWLGSGPGRGSGFGDFGPPVSPRPDGAHTAGRRRAGFGAGSPGSPRPAEASAADHDS